MIPFHPLLLSRLVSKRNLPRGNSICPDSEVYLITKNPVSRLLPATTAEYLAWVAAQVG
jgi:hypothetical protein